MASSASSPSKPADDELKLDELVSELQALKKLYGLLQNNSPKPARPDQPTAHALDEKSRHLLKKLLDGATQQALQSQAKTISCTAETPKSQAEPNSNPFNKDLQKEVRETQKNQECHSAAPPEDSPEAAISTPVAQLEITPNPCPIHEPTRPNHRRSKDATVHRCRANDSARLDRRIMSRPSESGSRRKSSQPSKNGSRRVQSIRSGGSERPPSSEKGSELLPLVPVQKRARVEPVDLPILASSRTNKPDQIDRELTHQKRTNRKETGAEPNSIGSMQSTRSSKYPNCRSIVLVGHEMAHIVQKNDQLAETKTRVTSNKHQKPARLNRSKANRFSSSSREFTPSISDSSRSIPSTQLKQNRIKTRTKLEPPPPQPQPPTLSNRKAQRSASLAKSLIVQKNDQFRETKGRASKPTKPGRPARSRAGRYSSSSTGSTRANSVSNRSTRPDLLTPTKQSRVQTRRRRRRRASSPASSKPPIPYHAIVPRWQPQPSRPAKTRVEPKQEEEQGRFKKLTNKLAIIFHHHHHHHHHLHAREDDEGGGGGRKDHERSLWKYLKGVLHAKKGSGEEKGKLLHRHNLRVMMEWFLRHLWWMRQRRRRKKKVERRRIAKKVKWWEWFRRKGGMVVGGRRRVRLRLGFTGSRRRAAGGKG